MGVRELAFRFNKIILLPSDWLVDERAVGWPAPPTAAALSTQRMLCFAQTNSLKLAANAYVLICLEIAYKATAGRVLAGSSHCVCVCDKVDSSLIAVNIHCYHKLLCDCAHVYTGLLYTLSSPAPITTLALPFVLRSQ